MKIVLDMWVKLCPILERIYFVWIAVQDRHVALLESWNRTAFF